MTNHIMQIKNELVGTNPLSFNRSRTIGVLGLQKKGILSNSISAISAIERESARDMPRTSCVSYSFPSSPLSFFLSRTSLFVSRTAYLGAKFLVSFHIHTHWGIATFFIPSRSRNVHFSPGVMHRRCRRRFIALLTFSVIRFSPATSWPWSKWNLLSWTICANSAHSSAPLLHPSSFSFFSYRIVAANNEQPRYRIEDRLASDSSRFNRHPKNPRTFHEKYLRTRL